MTDEGGPAKSKSQQLSWEMMTAETGILAIVVVKYPAIHV